MNDETKVSHAKLSEECEDQILDPAKKLGLKDIEADDVDICYSPIVQSGGEYELKMSAQSSDKKLHYGVVAISLGARHTQYCTNIARTLMIDPTKPMEDVYAAVLAAQEAALGALKDGADLAAPYDAAKAALESAEGLSDDTRAALVSKLGKNVGTAIGLELREPSLVLGPKSARRRAEGARRPVLQHPDRHRRPDQREGQGGEQRALTRCSSRTPRWSPRTAPRLRCSPRGSPRR